MTRLYGDMLFCAMVAHFAPTLIAADWAAYRGNSTRSAYVAAELPSQLAVRWSFTPSQPPRPAWPAPARRSYWQRLSTIAPRVVDDRTFHPVIAGNALLFGSSADDSVYCVDVATGEPKWQFTTDGPIRYAPAVANDRVLVGSDDGCIYCLAANSGDMVWLRRLGPEDRRIPGNGRVISAWPVRTGLLADGGVVYATCGLFPSQEVFAYALNVATGEVLWRRSISFSTQGYLLASHDRLFVPTGRANPIVLSKTDGQLVAELDGVGGTYAVVAGEELVAGPGNDGTLAASDFRSRERLINFQGTQLAASPTTSYLLSGDKLRSIDRRQFMRITRRINRKDAIRTELQEKIKKLEEMGAGSDRIEPLRRELEKANGAIVQMEKDRATYVNWEASVVAAGAMAACDNQIVLGGEGRVVAVDAQDGRQLWQETIIGTALGIALSDNQVIVSTDQGTFFCLSADPPMSGGSPAGVRDDGAVPTLSAAARQEPRPPTLPARQEPRPPTLPARQEPRPPTLPARQEPRPPTQLDRQELRPSTRRPDRSSSHPAEAETVFLNGLERAMHDNLSRRGYCLLLGVGDGSLAQQIAQMGDHVVVAIDRDLRRVEAVRRKLHNSGLYGGRIAVHHVQGDRLPFASYFANIVVCRSAIGGGEPAWSDAEIDRVLNPGNGFAWIRREAPPHRRRPPANAGEWTHLYANPSNTANSGGRGSSSDVTLQWFGGPGPSRMIDRHLRAPTPLCVGGRLFVPGENQMIAVDAYNGTELWEISLPGSQRYSMPYDAGYMTASREQIVIAVGGEARSFSTNDGQLQFARPLPKSLGMPKAHWGYLAVVKSQSESRSQHAKTPTPDPSPEDGGGGSGIGTNAHSNHKQGFRFIGTAQKPTASRTTPSRNSIDHDYGNGQPVVTSDAAFCIKKDGTTGWTYRNGVIVNPTITLGGGKMFFVESRNKKATDHATGRIGLQTALQLEAYLVALDTETGKVAWETPLSDHLTRCHNILYLQYVAENGPSGLLVATGSYHGEDDDSWYRLEAVDAGNGGLKWKAKHAAGKKGEYNHGEQVHHPVILGQWLVAEPLIYDLNTGNRVDPNGKNEPWTIVRPGHSCGTMSGSGSCLYFRAGNPTVLDLSPDRTGEERFRRLSPSRPGCWINVIPAGGLLLIPEASAGCVCHFSLQTSMAFVPAGNE